MKRKIKVLFVTAECFPYAKVGGLGQISESLPKWLFNQNIDIKRVTPFYRGSDCKVRYKADFPVKINNKYETCIIKTAEKDDDIATYFIVNDYYFNRDKVYSYFDDGERFLFFCKAVLNMLKAIPYKPDIIHCNDWHTGLLPLYLKKESFGGKVIFTIHNLKYQGCIGAEYVDELSKEEASYLGENNFINFMRSGFAYSDVITTVSDAYSKEIMENSFGMEDIIREKNIKIKGIINGIDNEKYNPSKEGDLIFPYSIKSIENKKKNKEALQRDLGLEVLDVPLIAVVGRLEEEKGIKLIHDAVLNIKKPFQFVLLGSKNIYYEQIFTKMQNNMKGKMKAIFEYNEALAKRIYASSDILLMPSLYEPCGISNIIALRYGSIPIVRSTGGLKDTIIDFTFDEKNGNGFCFEEYDSERLLDRINTALELYNTKKWDIIVKNAMKCDNSIEKTAQKYASLYRMVLE